MCVCVCVCACVCVGGAPRSRAQHYAPARVGNRRRAGDKQRENHGLWGRALGRPVRDIKTHASCPSAGTTQRTNVLGPVRPGVGVVARSERDCKHNLLCGGEVQFSVKRQGLKSRSQRAIGKVSEISLSPSFQRVSAYLAVFVRRTARYQPRWSVECVRMRSNFL